MKKVGIIGGTFNPIHIGHMILAESARTEFDLDEILFVPTGISYFKDPSTILDKKTRLDLVGDAICDNPYFAMSTIETDRPGNSYTYETLLELKKENPETEYYLIIGADACLQLEEWKHPEIIMKEVKILVAKRKGHATEQLMDKIAELKEKYHADIMLLTTPYIDISSTEIRERLKAGKSIRYLVRHATMEYIEAHGLYKD